MRSAVLCPPRKGYVHNKLEPLSMAMKQKTMLNSYRAKNTIEPRALLNSIAYPRRSQPNPTMADLNLPTTTVPQPSPPPSPNTSSTNLPALVPSVPPSSPTILVETMAARFSQELRLRSPGPRARVLPTPYRDHVGRFSSPAVPTRPSVGCSPRPAAIREPRPPLQYMGRGRGRPPPQYLKENDDEYFLIGKLLSARPPNPNSLKVVTVMRVAATAKGCPRFREAVLGLDLDWASEKSSIMDMGPKFLTGFTLLGPHCIMGFTLLDPIFTIGFTLLGPEKVVQQKEVSFPAREYPDHAESPNMSGSAASA